MTFAVGHRGDYHVLAKIELTGLTLYYADANLSMSDGNYYDGRLSVSNLQRAFSSFTEPKQRDSTLTITLRDADYTIRNLLETYTWGNREVTIYLGKGRDLDDYIIDFSGFILIPGGISFTRDDVSIKLRDIRNKYVRDLPINKYWKTDFPNLEEGLEGTPIPVGYGDFSDAWVTVYCIDTVNSKFKICDHAIKEITSVTKNSEVTTNWGNENLTNATFDLFESYDPVSDKIGVKFKGKPDDEGNLIENPVDVLTDMQTSLIGIPIEDIDTDSYDELADELEDYKCRRYITDETSTDTLIGELAIECLFDLFIEDGLYTVRSRMPKVTYDISIDETMIAQGSLQVESDPENLYANRIKCNYFYRPATKDFAYTLQEDNTIEQSRISQIIPRTIDFNWLYNWSNVIAHAQHFLLLYSKEIAVIQITALGDAILSGLADRVGLTFGHYTDRPLVVRELSRQYNSMSCALFAYDEVKHVLPGYITANDAPDYTDATAEERGMLGFVTDEDGFAEPGNEESGISRIW